MSKNDMVKVTICGRELLLTSGDDPEYIMKIAKKVDSSISKLMKSNVGVGFEQAAALVAIKCFDDYEKKVSTHQKRTKEDEELGKRLVEYSKELTRANTKIKALEKEIAKLKKEQN